MSCPPDSIVSAVLSVLKICRGFSSPADCREVSRNVIGSSKVQKCALEALTALSNSPGKYLCMCLFNSSGFIIIFVIQCCRFASVLCDLGVKQMVSDVFSVLIDYLDNPDSDPTVSKV